MINNEISPKVSIVVPVWNPGSGINRCVESLRGQTLEDIEMVFVDDCGTDYAMDIVRAAAAEDPRIRIITNAENMGPGPSRNAGIKAAHGMYLSFVDADDYVDAYFLECSNAAEEDLCRLYRKAEALCIKENSQLPPSLVRDVKKICRLDKKSMKQTIRTFIAKIPLAKPLYCVAKRWRNT